VKLLHLKSKILNLEEFKLTKISLNQFFRNIEDVNKPNKLYGHGLLKL
jgi:hypothetical protein